MAAAIIEVDVGIPAAAGLTLDLYPHASDAVAVAGLAMAEQTNRKGVYRTTTVAGLSGVHRAEVKSGTSVLASGYVRMSDTAAVHVVVDSPAAATIDGTGIVAGTVLDKTGYSLSGTLTTFDALWAKIQKWLRLGFRKDAAVATDHATELAEINANGGSGAGAFANTTDALEAIRDRGDAAWTTGGGGGSGSGAYTVTITVTSSGSPVEGAVVRLSKTGEAYTATTNASGVASFALDASTWTVGITAGGTLTFTPTTLVVSTDAAQSYSMTANTPSAPASPLLSTGYVDCYGLDGAAEEGVEIEIEMTAGPGTAGYALDKGTYTATSAANGRATHSGFVRGAAYRARRGELGKWVAFTVPNAGTFAMPEMLGQP